MSSRYSRTEAHMNTQRLTTSIGPVEVPGIEDLSSKKGDWIHLPIPNMKLSPINNHLQRKIILL